MSEPSAALNDPRFLQALLNLVIPPEGPMPGAGDLDLWPAVAGPLGRDARALASLAAGLDAVRAAALLRHPGGLADVEPAVAMEVVHSLTGQYPAMMPLLARATAAVYYQQPAVLIALGEPARPPFPEGFELEQISPEWLALLKSRAQRRPA